MHPHLRTLLVLMGLLAMACATPGRFVWVNDYQSPAASTKSGYVIDRGDILNVRVWNQEGMTTRARVRADGRISVPLLGEVEAAGYQPQVLAAQLQTRLKDFLVNPVVTVALDEVRIEQVAVAGEVSRPGTYPLDPGTGLLHVLTAAGGLSEFADKTAIYVLRPNGEQVDRIRFSWESLSRAEGRAATFRMRGGDSVVVE